MSDSITEMSRLIALQMIRDFVVDHRETAAIVVSNQATHDQFDHILLNDLGFFYVDGAHKGAARYYQDQKPGYTGCVGLYLANESSHVFVRHSFMFDLSVEQETGWRQTIMSFNPEFHSIKTCEER